MKCETTQETTLFPHDAIGGRLAGGGDLSPRGNRLTAVFKCTHGCRHKVSVSGFISTVVVYDLSGSSERGILHVDSVVPAVPLFEIKETYPKTAASDTFRTFRLFWVDPQAAMNSLRTAVESLLVHEWMATRRPNAASANDFLSWRKTRSFDDRKRELFPEVLEQRILSALWECGNFHSHFNFDDEDQLTLTKHLEIAVSLLHVLLDRLGTPNRSRMTDEPLGLSDLEKYFSDRAKEARVRQVFAQQRK